MTARPAVSDLERRLAVPADEAGFGEADLAGLPEQVCRYLRAAVSPGVSVARAVRVTMRGRLKLGRRWVPFRGREVLAPHEGFVWAGRAAGIISGSDHYVDGEGVLDWRLFGMVRVAHAEGPDVARSSAGRAAGEAIWVPTALLPRFGVRWDAGEDGVITAATTVDGHEHTVTLTVDQTGRLLSATLLRWGEPDATGSFAWHRFGVTATAHASLSGLTIPSAGRAGWHHGTDRWEEGEFFRYRLTAMHPVGPAEP